MVTDSKDNIVYASPEMMMTYGEPYVEHNTMEEPKSYGEHIDRETGEITQLTELDDELGLPVIPKKTIFEKYGVHCDPRKNSFYESLYHQFEKKGSLSEKQVNALRNSR